MTFFFALVSSCSFVSKGDATRTTGGGGDGLDVMLMVSGAAGADVVFDDEGGDGEISTRSLGEWIGERVRVGLTGLGGTAGTFFFTGVGSLGGNDFFIGFDVGVSFFKGVFGLTDGVDGAGGGGGGGGGGAGVGVGVETGGGGGSFLTGGGG